MHIHICFFHGVFMVFMGAPQLLLKPGTQSLTGTGLLPIMAAYVGGGRAAGIWVGGEGVGTVWGGWAAGGEGAGAGQWWGGRDERRRGGWRAGDGEVDTHF